MFINFYFLTMYLNQNAGYMFGHDLKTRRHIVLNVGMRGQNKCVMETFYFGLRNTLKNKWSDVLIFVSVSFSIIK